MKHNNWPTKLLFKNGKDDYVGITLTLTHTDSFGAYYIKCSGTTSQIRYIPHSMWNLIKKQRHSSIFTNRFHLIKYCEKAGQRYLNSVIKYRKTYNHKASESLENE